MRDVRSSNMSAELKVSVYLHIHERLRHVAEAEALPALKFVNENVYYLSTRNAGTLEAAKNSVATNLSLSLISGQMGASEALLASQILGLDPFIVFRSLDKDKESVHKKAREAHKTVSEYLAESYVNPVGSA